VIPSADRILTTHTGSLPRPPELRALLGQIDAGEQVDPEMFTSYVEDAVSRTVAHQVELGLDIVNDGEMSKANYTTYVTQRLSGFGSTGVTPTVGDAVDFPEWATAAGLDDIGTLVQFPACVGDVKYVTAKSLDEDIRRLRGAAEVSSPTAAFMTAASPGVIALFLENKHYEDREAYVAALARAMKTEYDAIHRSGLILQIDCPDLAMGRHYEYREHSLAEWQQDIRYNVEMLNMATQDIPPEAMRLHVCWGNYAGPHHLDVPLADVIDIVLGARPAGIVFEAANPRHAHEWKVFRDVQLPSGKVLVPGVIDSTTPYIEHPELVAERITQFASVVGPENVIAGVDCGFGTSAEWAPIDSRIVSAKLRSLVEGAAIASAAL
jgi:5-methyltetrahydropteroyltriglutamate--homocysteine methyltransferase